MRGRNIAALTGGDSQAASTDGRIVRTGPSQTARDVVTWPANKISQGGFTTPLPASLTDSWLRLQNTGSDRLDTPGRAT